MTRTFLLLLTLLVGCASNPPQARPLAVQLDEITNAFVGELGEQGIEAQSYFGLFLPEDTVNRRYLKEFRSAVERSLRKASGPAGIHYNATMERVFFLSRVKAEGWKAPDARDGAVLAAEVRRGTSMGWTALNTFWSQYNRLLVGDAAWIQNLPDSVKADLSHPLEYVLRIVVDLRTSQDAVTHRHQITYEMVRVGRGETLLSRSYPLVLTYALP